MDFAEKPTTVVIERLDDALDRPQTICVIGAAAVLSLGHASRQTGEIDVWRPASSINDRALARAGKAAGIAIDNRTDLPDGVYLQIIRPGVVQLPPFVDGLWATGDANVTVWEGDKLRVEAAPAAVIAAAKLVRAEDRDLDDCIFLIRSNQTSRGSILRAIHAIQDPGAIGMAEENIVLLDVMASRHPEPG